MEGRDRIEKVERCKGCGKELGKQAWRNDWCCSDRFCKECSELHCGRYKEHRLTKKEKEKEYADYLAERSLEAALS